MAFYEKIIDLAKTQVGYHEGRSNGSWNNDQKYSKEVPGFGWSNYQAWCATFNTWLDWKLGLTKGAGDNSKSPCTASVGEAYQWGKNKGRFTEYPVIGAWVIFRVNEHTERCIGFDSTYVYTIGGNTNASYSPQGDGVYMKKYARTEAKITGYVVPVFPDGAYKSPDPKWNKGGLIKVIDMTKTSTASKPAAISLKATLAAIHAKPQVSNKNVLAVQTVMNRSSVTRTAGVNHDLVSGVWDADTRKAFAHYQHLYSDRNKLGWTAADCDGIPGQESFASLMRWRNSYTPVA